MTESTFLDVVTSADIMPGADRALSEFRKRGWITAIISGGFKASADRVQKELKIDHALSGCEYFFSKESGLIEHFNLLPSDQDGKVDFMRLIAKEHGINERGCVFVGDGKNDVALAKEAGVSIAFNAQKELKEVCDIIIEQREGEEDFYQVVKKLFQL